MSKLGNSISAALTGSGGRCRGECKNNWTEGGRAGAGVGGVSMAPRCRVEGGGEEEWDYCTTCRGDSCPDETSVPRLVMV